MSANGTHQPHDIERELARVETCLRPCRHPLLLPVTVALLLGGVIAAEALLMEAGVTGQRQAPQGDVANAAAPPR